MKKLILVVGLLMGGSSAHASLDKLQDFWTLLGTQRAKDFCSCYFVVGQTRDYCADFVAHGIPVDADQLPVIGQVPVFGVTIDEANRAIVVNGFRAHWVSQELGCVLD